MTEGHDAATGLSPAWATLMPAPPLRSRHTQAPVFKLWRAAVLALVLACHVLAFFALARGMRLKAPVTAPDNVVQVRLIDTPPPVALPAPPQRVAPAIVTATGISAVRALPSTSTPKPLPAQPTPEPTRVSSAHLYDAEGDIILPVGAASTPPAAIPGYRSGVVAGAAKMPTVRNPVPYHATKLDKYWVSDQETALDEVIRKSTVAHNILTLPGGYHVRCAISPLMLAGGCGIVGQQQLAAPVKARDRIDNLAPATALIPKRTTPAKATSTAQPARSGTAPFVPRD